MGLIQPDLIVKDALIASLGAVKSDPTLLGDVFGDRSAGEISEIETWFGANDVAVKLGFPREPAELPGLFVYVGSSNEDQQLVGGEFPDGKNDPDASHQSEYTGSYFVTSLRIACWSMNADLTVWLQNVALWTLLQNRMSFNRQGMHEQRITAGDFEPLPQWFPDFAFRRDLMLSAKHAATFKQVFGKIAEVDVAATATAPFSGEVYRASLRR